MHSVLIKRRFQMFDPNSVFVIELFFKLYKDDTVIL